RVRTGCLVCRARKVKCDEQRPSCQKCLRLNRICEYQAPIGRATSRDEPQQGGQCETNHGPSDFPGHDRPLGSNRDFFNHDEPAGPDSNSHWGGIDMTSSLEQQTNTPGTIYSYPGSFGSPFHEVNSRSTTSEHHFASNDSVDRYHAASQLIYLTTIMDWRAASEGPALESYSYFLDTFDYPLLSSFDPLNWTWVKRHITTLGITHFPVAESLLVAQAVYRAQADRLSMSHATSIYRNALTTFGSISGDHAIDFDVILAVALLLCLCAVTFPNDDSPPLTVLDGDFVGRLEVWLAGKSRSAISLRICAWLQLLNITTKRPGYQGLLPSRVLDLLYEHVKEVPSLATLNSDAQQESLLLDTLATPVFNFYLSVQAISNRVADVTHYRRSRTTSADQEEVTEILANVKADLSRLWEHRPALLQLQPNAIREHMSANLADQIVALCGICLAAFHTEIISIGRILGDPPFPSPEATEALAQIRRIIEGDWNVSANGSINPGYTRPLFMYGLESYTKEGSDWVIGKMRQIRHPIGKNNFLASFLELHGEAQRAQSRRVTMKYFCYQTFRVHLPFL
ncbi:hypothetical protein BU24DRAFT_313171, partial [Aaosphaeria arxii CBS 175.79]